MHMSSDAERQARPSSKADTPRGAVTAPRLLSVLTPHRAACPPCSSGAIGGLRLNTQAHTSSQHSMHTHTPWASECRVPLGLFAKRLTWRVTQTRTRPHLTRDSIHEIPAYHREQHLTAGAPVRVWGDTLVNRKLPCNPMHAATVHPSPRPAPTPIAASGPLSYRLSVLHRPGYSNACALHTRRTPEPLGTHPGSEKARGHRYRPQADATGGLQALHVSGSRPRMLVTLTNRPPYPILCY
jgi:hypothetical protein